MPNKRQPYVGDAAFAHLGGVHIHAVLKNAATYEHIDPSRRREPSPNPGLRLCGTGGLDGKGRNLQSFVDQKPCEAPGTRRDAQKARSQGYQFEAPKGPFGC